MPTIYHGWCLTGLGGDDWVVLEGTVRDAVFAPKNDAGEWSET